MLDETFETLRRAGARVNPCGEVRRNREGSNMATVIYSMQVSADGYIEGPGGELDWAIVDEELHRHFNDQERATDTLLYGRRLYELMASYWPTADSNPETPDYMREYAEIWKSKPKIVFSATLDRVEWNSRLAETTVGEEIGRLKEQSATLISIGGATLAAGAIELGLVDEYWLYMNPVILGGGKPMFPRLDDRIALRLVGTRAFSSGVVLVRYSSDAPADEARSSTASRSSVH
jgi:dihydrofolate reductase